MCGPNVPENSVDRQPRPSSIGGAGRYSVRVRAELKRQDEASRPITAPDFSADSLVSEATDEILMARWRPLPKFNARTGSGEPLR
jgi:hypothetical protein